MTHATAALRTMGSTIVQRLDRMHAPQTLALLGELRLSLFGVQSPRLHAALVADAVSGAIECRVAADADRVVGLVLAAPASYWRSALLRHWGLAMECALARVRATTHAGTGRAEALPADTRSALSAGTPSRTWAAPGDAWRIILVGTAADARGRGIAARLYRSLMAERSLVARIAQDNTPSIRLHRSLGWRLYADGPVVLAVYERGRQAA